MFRDEKATAVAAFFLEHAPNGTLDDLALMKLMVIAERKLLAQSNSLITGARFVSMQNGPVLSEVLQLMRRPDDGGMWHRHIRYVPHGGPGTPSNHCVLVAPVVTADVLSKYEIEMLQAVWAEHGRTPKWCLVDLTHAFPEWDRSCADTKSSSPISIEEILRLGFDQPPATARERAEAIEYFEQVAG